MNIPREEQTKFAKAILPIIEKTKSLDELEGLYELVQIFETWTGDDDNGIAFDVGEYLFETIEEAKGKEPSGWRESALKSLKDQIGE